MSLSIFNLSLAEVPVSYGKCGICRKCCKAFQTLVCVLISHAAVRCAGSDQSDETLLGFSTSCNDDDVSEDAQDEDDMEVKDVQQSDHEDGPQADATEIYPSDDDSGDDGVSSGLSHSDCDSPAMGLSAFDGPLGDVQESGNGRSALSPTLLSHHHRCIAHL